MIRRVFVLCILLCALTQPCFGEELAFGGRGEDILTEAVAADGGYFAVGTTASSDGDLATRKRSGETGWAARISADGRLLWNFCSGKSGMLAMTAPHAYGDGRFSLVLTDEARQRGEWIVLGANGGQESRAAIPDIGRICPQGKAGLLIGMAAASGSTGPYLALLLSHEGSGALCCTALFPDGGLRACGEFYGDAGGALRALDDGLVHIGVDLGAAALTRLRPGVPPETAVIPLAGEDAGLSRVTDALVLGDESIVLCGQTVTADQKSKGILLRLSAAQETLFMKPLGESEPTLLTETDTGYAVYLREEGSVRFYDEDGAAQGSVQAAREPLDIVPADGGVYVLAREAERGRRQAVFSYLATPQGALEPETETVAFAAEEPAQQSRAADRLDLGKGYLLCSGSYGGVYVSHVDATGEVRWKTRIPIHTAADRLVWEAAQILPDGDILLTGSYETDMPEGTLREGAQARLGADGVLKEIGLTQ